MRNLLTRRCLLGAAPLFALPLTFNAFAAARIPRIGFLIGTIPGTVSPLEGAFRDELKRQGLIEDQTIIVEIRRSLQEGDLERQAKELAAMDLDLIVAAALPQALAVRAANPRMPMVVGTAPGFVANGFAKSLTHPGGIVTGMDELLPGITAKRLDLLTAAVPARARIALLSTTPGVGGHEVQLAEAEHAAARLGVKVTPYRAGDIAELKQALAAIARDKQQAMLNFQGGLALGQRHMIVAFAEENRLPAIYQSLLFVQAGGLMSYAPDQEEQFRVAARLTATILKGTRPGDLPIAHPDRYFLAINNVAAEAIGLRFPSSIAAKADMVIDRGRRTT
ncbi:MAG: ABC transporter substrate-binding protein [Sphingomonas sp.]|nr:ABC transporter substrate-binding protein [Sphingomonas sp.]